MKRSVMMAVWCVGSFSLTGCLGEGNPWGLLEPSLSAAFAPGEGRLTTDGALKTSSDYGVSLTVLSVSLGTLEVLEAAGGEALSFDPANPPEGYGACHNGHCHSSDGRLVSYEEIEAELNGGTLPEGPSVSLSVEFTLELGVAPQAVPLGECPDGCTLEKGTLDKVSLSLTRLAFEGRVQDVSSQGRLPTEGVPVSGILPLSLEVTGELEGTVGKGESLQVGVDATFYLADALFDGLDWAALLAASDDPARITVAADSAAAAQIAENLSEHSRLETLVTRGE